MIRIDRKVARAIQKLTDDYDETVCYEPGRGLSTDEKSVSVKVRDDDIPDALERLCEAGYVDIYARTAGSACFFTITSRLRHRRAFWFDSFTKRFVAGFISGFLSAAAAGIIAGLVLRII